MGLWITRTTTTGLRPHHGGALLDVRFMEDRVRLEIPPLYVEQTTAPLLQNLIAFEQQVGADGVNYCTTYAFLMYNLVSTREDITLLQDLRILHNNFGSHKKVSLCNETSLITINLFFLNKLGSIPVRCYGTAKLLYLKHMDRTIR
jgi:hypothetical protein